MDVQLEILLKLASALYGSSVRPAQDYGHIIDVLVAENKQSSLRKAIEKESKKSRKQQKKLCKQVAKLGEITTRLEAELKQQTRNQNRNPA